MSIRSKSIKHGRGRPPLADGEKRPQPPWLRQPIARAPAAITAANQKAQAEAAPPVHLLDKKEVCAIAGATFPTIWAWMRDGKFPRGRIVGGKTMWLSSDISNWLAALPVRPLKGDAEAVSA